MRKNRWVPKRIAAAVAVSAFAFFTGTHAAGASVLPEGMCSTFTTLAYSSNFKTGTTGAYSFGAKWEAGSPSDKVTDGPGAPIDGNSAVDAGQNAAEATLTGSALQMQADSNASSCPMYNGKPCDGLPWEGVEMDTSTAGTTAGVDLSGEFDVSWRANLDGATGQQADFPALWLIDDTDNVPQYQELDVAEYTNGGGLCLHDVGEGGALCYSPSATDVSATFGPGEQDYNLCVYQGTNGNWHAQVQVGTVQYENELLTNWSSTEGMMIVMDNKVANASNGGPPDGSTQNPDDMLVKSVKAWTP